MQIDIMPTLDSYLNPDAARLFRDYA